MLKYTIMKSFESIEKSLEDRLHPKRRTIGESQLREHDQKKLQLPASKIFHIEFSKSFQQDEELNSDRTY